MFCFLGSHLLLLLIRKRSFITLNIGLEIPTCVGIKYPILTVEIISRVAASIPRQRQWLKISGHFVLEVLFSDYWRLYVSQLPEAVFSQVNENFYRTTFFELYNRYLSIRFTWNVERSYPKGRTLMGH